MSRKQSFDDCNLDDGDPLRILLEGTAKVTGERFFEALVENLAKAMHTKHAWITEYIPDLRRLNALAFWVDGELISDFEVDIDGTPCEAVIDKVQLVHYPQNIQQLFPRSLKLKELGAVSYMGVPLMDLNGNILGHLAVIDDRRMPDEPQRLALFKIFAARASAELQRIRAESAVKERENRLSLLVGSAMDAIIEMDRDLNIILLNPAAEGLLGQRDTKNDKINFGRLLSPESHRKLTGLMDDLTTNHDDKKHIWVPDGLTVVNGADLPVAVEATLSRFETGDQVLYLLILRDIDERIAAERKILALREEADYLRAELDTLGHFAEIVGQSRPLKRVLRSAQQVARADSTVLISGETGTGKELIARAIHRASLRSGKPFVTVNCAVLPEKLFESELFGHEAGAFTGADRRRIGRFELADGGTLFLDEIGELCLEVQAKLLRVLQEGQFERVGGSATLTVDVRVIAASNRPLEQDILDRRFRADLFYRLNVYPITIPPLRDRKADIPLLVDYFLPRIARRISQGVYRAPADTMGQLMAYDWPGNVRELKNVLERAIITSPSTTLRLPEPLRGSSPLPETGFAEVAVAQGTLRELVEVERNHIADVLQATGWRISGPKGAAVILGLNPSTLRYRIKKLNITPAMRSSAG